MHVPGQGVWDPVPNAAKANVAGHEAVGHKSQLVRVCQHPIDSDVANIRTILLHVATETGD